MRHQRTADEATHIGNVLSKMGVDVETGLSREEAKRRLAKHGANILVPRQRTAAWLQFLRPLSDPMVLLLAGGGVVYFLLGDFRDGTILLVAAIPIVIMDLILEIRAGRTLGKLKRLTSPRVEVLREGRKELIPSEELVPGDVFFLKEGDIVPVDALLVVASDLEADESALTGESIPVEKNPTVYLPESTPLPEQLNKVFAGTTILLGTGTAIVTATGLETEYGKIGAAVAKVPPQLTPVQKAIRGLVQRLALAAGAVSVAVVLLELTRGASWQIAIISGVTLAIAAIPEEFPMTFTLYLSLGVWRMAGKNALIRRLVGVETLGSTTTICSDKTGTLTFGKMAVDSLHVGGALRRLGETPADENVANLLRGAALASEPNPYDPMEQAILASVWQAGLNLDSLYSYWTLVYEYPFDPAAKYVSHIWEGKRGELRLCAKGAIEGILSLCSITEEERDWALSGNKVLAGEGKRVIAVAEKSLTVVAGQRQEDENDLHFLGLVGLADPLRPGVRHAVAQCLDAGIRVILITGDHPLTAHAVADGIGLPHKDKDVALGAQVDELNDEDFRTLLDHTNIFARTMPIHKLRIVQTLKAMGETVAMTGDGINDAPALRQADIGVAMGQRGTEVAREAATMVLLDDNFSTIVEAVKEGRRTFDCLQRAFSYLIAFHIPILGVALLVPLLGAPLLLLPVHLVWLELIIHPTASLVFQADAPDPDLMRRPPRRFGRSILTSQTLVRLLAEGLTSLGAVLFIYLWVLNEGYSEDRARAVGLSTLILAQVLLVLMERSPDRPFWRAGLRGNWYLPVILLAVLASLVIFTYVPVFYSALHLAPLSGGDWLLSAAAAGVSTLWVEVVKGFVARDITSPFPS
ncbi:MAG: cation-transporting P-type ATPase [Chloroflexi bacterium]|nr:cation-transporting P-type ATPase [Chloroflexota bacterium]